MVVSTSWDSSLQVYDEDSDSRLLRKSTGGHGDEDISCLEISNHLSLIATGSGAGSVVVWDFEMSKIDGICIGHHKTVTALKFIEEYPLLISISQDATL